MGDASVARGAWDRAGALRQVGEIDCEVIGAMYKIIKKIEFAFINWFLRYLKNRYEPWRYEPTKWRKVPQLVPGSQPGFYRDEVELVDKLDDGYRFIPLYDHRLVELVYGDSMRYIDNSKFVARRKMLRDLRIDNTTYNEDHAYWDERYKQLCKKGIPIAGAPLTTS